MNRTISSYPAYQLDKITAIFLVSLVGISLLAWIIQSIQTRFQPRRLIILILVAHLTIFIELILRAVLCSKTRQLKGPLIVSSIVLAVCQRVILVANNAFLIQANDPNSHRSRVILILSILTVATSGILFGVGSALSNNIRTINASIRLRQVSSMILLIKAIVFYPLWFIIRTERSTSIFAILLLTISSLGSLIVAIFLLFTSFPSYSEAINGDEEWSYFFRFIPLVFVLCTWTILHPKRSLTTTISSPKETLLEDVDNHL